MTRATFDPPSDVVLAHYGVKGMKWGVHRDRSPVAVTVKQTPGKYVKAKGGKNQPASEDAVRVAQLRQTAKKSTPDALSTRELQELVNRMGLEERYADLTSKTGDVRASRGKQAVKAILSDPENKQITLERVGQGASLALTHLPAGRATKIGVGVGAMLARGAVQKMSGGKKKK